MDESFFYVLQIQITDNKEKKVKNNQSKQNSHSTLTGSEEKSSRLIAHTILQEQSERTMQLHALDDALAYHRHYAALHASTSYAA